MKNITIEFIKKFIASNHIPFTPTQQRLCVPIILRMCQKMSNDIKFDEIKVCDDLIIDGHHRYLSSLMMNFKLDHVLSNSTSATQKIEWRLVEFDEEDWDTQAKIEYLNEIDAKFNNVEIEFVRQITSR
ncbi:hypothetical protein ACFQZS_07730 [Mucilaginibacter calamicampi]|uniref:ParB/Sulfiredoxin domain-containing protein n=1 Tax=Mucilaginibacter calamicampi TaxID=1302352 RepID=A0ABW2YXB8_9SPHI